MRFLLHLNQLGERGTETSTFELGNALKMLGHSVTIAYPKDSQNNRLDVKNIFKTEFDMYPYSKFSKQDKWVKNNIDFAYFLKIDGLDGLGYKGIFNATHTVFPEYLPHGNTYTYISKWLAHESNRLAHKKLRLLRRGPVSLSKGCKNAMKFQHVPHIVNMPKPSFSVRESLGIPEDAFLILRYGGVTEFNVGWVKDTLIEELEKNHSWYFLGVNTEKFTKHPRALFLPAITDKQRKSNLLNDANVFLHARLRGESFGMSLVESLQVGTPVLSFSGGVDQNHVDLLSNTNCLYESPQELKRKLLDLGKNEGQNWKEENLIKIGDKFRPANLIDDYLKIIFRI
jgi:glycosyltransferase involved in cell wall biosynthesis